MVWARVGIRVGNMLPVSPPSVRVRVTRILTLTLTLTLTLKRDGAGARVGKT